VEEQHARYPKETVTWAPDRIVVAAAGDLAIETGTAQLSGVGPAGDRTDRLSYLTVWKLVNGEWKVARDIATPSLSSPYPPPAANGTA
jgi:ketosteroid isomerase-like protein